MFQVKFMSHYPDGTSVETSLSCPRYALYHRSNGTTEVTIYPGFTDVGGVSFQVGNSEALKDVPHYTCAFITNASGVTVERVK